VVEEWGAYYSAVPLLLNSWFVWVNLQVVGGDNDAIRGAPFFAFVSQHVFFPFNSVVYITHWWQLKNCRCLHSICLHIFPMNVPTSYYLFRRRFTYSHKGHGHSLAAAHSSGTPILFHMIFITVESLFAPAN
jgi:hypothetical protein